MKLSRYTNEIRSVLPKRDELLNVQIGAQGLSALQFKDYRKF